MPGAPATVTSRQARSSRACANAACSVASSRARPTNGVDGVRSSAGCSRRSSSRRPLAASIVASPATDGADAAAEQDLARGGALGQAAGGGDRGSRSRPSRRAARRRGTPRRTRAPAAASSVAARSSIAARAARSASSPCDSVEPEDADERVAEVALDAAAVLLDDGGAAVEHAVQDLGVGDVRARREHRDEPARLRRGGVGRTARPSPPAASLDAHRGQRRDDGVGRRRAPLRLLGEQRPGSGGRARRDVRARARDGGTGADRQVLGEHVRGVLGGERRAPGDELVERDAERVEVAGRTDLLAADLLGREVADRADDDRPRRSGGRRRSRWAMPKSPSAALPSASSQTLSGLTSRCTTPLAWACASAAAISRPMRITSARASRSRAMRRPASRRPSRAARGRGRRRARRCRRR